MPQHIPGTIIGRTAEIWARLRNKLLLEAGSLAQGPAVLMDGVRLVTSVDDLLANTKCTSANETASAGLGDVLVLFTVPAGKRIQVYVTNHFLEGDNTASNLTIVDVSTGDICVVASTVTTTRQVTAIRYWLDEHDQIRVSMGGAGSSSTTVYLDLSYVEYPMY